MNGADCNKMHLFCHRILGHLTLAQRKTATGTHQAMLTIEDKAVIGICRSATDLEAAIVVVPPGVETIAFGAFQNYSRIYSLKLPDTVTSVEAHAFANCGTLASVALSANLTSIGVGAFEACRELTSVAFRRGRPYEAF